jgi:hypothetical protein
VDVAGLGELLRARPRAGIRRRHVGRRPRAKPEQKKPKTVQITLGANPDTKTIESADPQANSRDPAAVA